MCAENARAYTRLRARADCRAGAFKKTVMATAAITCKIVRRWEEQRRKDETRRHCHARYPLYSTQLKVTTARGSQDAGTRNIDFSFQLSTVLWQLLKIYFIKHYHSGCKKLVSHKSTPPSFSPDMEGKEKCLANGSISVGKRTKIITLLISLCVTVLIFPHLCKTMCMYTKDVHMVCLLESHYSKYTGTCM